MHRISNMSRLADEADWNNGLETVGCEVFACDTTEAIPSFKFVIDDFTLFIIFVSVPIEVLLRDTGNLCTNYRVSNTRFKTCTTYLIGRKNALSLLL